MQTNRISFLIIVALLTAMAGGMGWGIRGQYGHETGAMVAGVLMGFTLVLFFWPQATSLSAARVVALTVLGISFGGSMTYGQTVGLTHDSPLVGNWAALRWGMLGWATRCCTALRDAGAGLACEHVGFSQRDARRKPRLQSMILVCPDGCC